MALAGLGERPSQAWGGARRWVEVERRGENDLRKMSEVESPAFVDRQMWERGGERRERGQLLVCLLGRCEKNKKPDAGLHFEPLGVRWSRGLHSQLDAGLAFGREWTVGGGTWAWWLVATLEAGRLVDAQGTCDSGKRGRWRAEPWEGLRSREGWKVGLTKQSQKEQLEAS